MGHRPRPAICKDRCNEACNADQLDVLRLGANSGLRPNQRSALIQLTENNGGARPEEPTSNSDQSWRMIPRISPACASFGSLNAVVLDQIWGVCSLQRAGLGGKRGEIPLRHSDRGKRWFSAS